MSKIIPLKELNERIDNLISDFDYRLSRARSPRSKRHSKAMVNFFTSIKHHLNAEKNDNNS